MKTIVLAGGQSRRMGQNKAVMKIEGQEIIQHIIHTFLPISQEVFVVTNEPDHYQHLGVTILEDHPSFKSQGPLAGLFTGLTAAGTDHCFLTACDMPFVSAGLAEWLIESLKHGRHDAVIPVDNGKRHFLFGAYRGEAAMAAKENLLKGRLAMRSLLENADVRFVEKGDAPKDLQAEWELCFWNMNTMEEYREALEIIKKKKCKRGEPFEL